MNIYRASLDGETVAHRITKRTYSHVVIAWQPFRSNPQFATRMSQDRRVIAWCGRTDLAISAARKARMSWAYVEIVELELIKSDV
jgi:hypothetical protein